MLNQNKISEAEPQKLIKQLREVGLYFTQPIDINTFLYYIYQGIKVSVKTK